MLLNNQLFVIRSLFLILVFCTSFVDANNKTSGMNYIVSVVKKYNASIPISKNYKKESEFQKDLSPIINNFNIQNDQPRRVYFDSSEIIIANNFKGFIIADKIIISVTINSGKTTGHYFTVSVPFTFWDNSLIRYEGGSDLIDAEGKKLHKFTLRYVLNNIDEPETSISYFVSVDGNDANDGLSEQTAWRTISKAGLQATSGSTVWVKSGNYGAENVIIKNNGYYLKPIKFIGYKTTKGDNPLLTRSVGMVFDSREMPLLSGGSGAAITSKNNNYVIIRNIQIDDYSEYGIQYDNSDYTVIDNVYVNDCKWSIRTIDAEATNNRIMNSYVSNASQTGVEVQNKNNLIKNTWAVSSYASGMDYYLTIRGGNEGTNNIIRNCYVNRFLNDSHSGHGISLKADQHMRGYSIENNLVEDCAIIGSRLELRHRSVKNNVIRNCTLDGHQGIMIRDGASYNIIENVTISNALFFVMWFESIENGGTNENGHHNKFINCIGDTCDKLIRTGNHPKDQLMEQVIQYNEWINCTFKNISKLYYPNSRTGNPDVDVSNKMTNCIFMNCPRLGTGIQHITFDYNDFYNGFPQQSGIGNFSTNPLLDNSYEPQASNPNLKVPRILGIDYDKKNLERSNPTTVGAIEKN